MAIHPSNQGAGFARPQQQLTTAFRMPAPNKGIDARVAYGEMNTNNCIYAYNLVPSENGMLVRQGFSEWQIGLESTTNLGVRSIMQYTSADGASDKIFAATNEGIWDVTVRGETPILKVAFLTDTTAAAGSGTHVQYTNDAGAEFIFYADSKNGLYTYTQSTDSWAVTTGITGVTIADVVFIVVHKQRIWLIEENSTSAWYLPVGAPAGEATQFFFGTKFPNGGILSALINWSVDGGAGIDDFLVAVGSGGDVLPYTGTDPSLDTWTLEGTYNIGSVPTGRRFFGEYSGELYMLSSFGMVSMGDLLRGVDVRDVSSHGLTFPISELIRKDLAQSHTRLGWEVRFVPSQGNLVILAPENLASMTSSQYVMNLSIEGWGLWRDVPMQCSEEVGFTLYFGTRDGRIMAMDSTRDCVMLDKESLYAAGEPIEYSLLTGYSDLGSPSQFKRGAFVRPDFLAVTSPSYQTRILYDYEVGEAVFAVPSYDVDLVEGSWDSGIWDEAVWGVGSAVGYSSLQGQCGIGRTLAVALRGESSDETRLVSFDLMWQTGGLL